MATGTHVKLLWKTDVEEPGFELNYPGLRFKDFPGNSGSGSTREASLLKIDGCTAPVAKN